MRFIRTLKQRLLFEHKDDDRSYLPKFAMPATRGSHYTDLLEDKQRAADPHAFDLLDLYTKHTSSLLRSASDFDHRSSLIQRQRRNFSTTDADFIRRLMTDPAITIKPADKNLGMVLVDTAWYEAELSRMLGDSVTYQPFSTYSERRPHGRGSKVVIVDFPAHQKLLLMRLTQLATSHAKSFEQWDREYGTDLADQVPKFLSRKISDETCSVPTIYLLIKVHKASGLCGRPIVPATHWLTTPASVVVDHLLQEIFRKANIQHIVKDTKSFVNELEHLRMPHGDGVFVTADIASLYTNIDTKMGLALVEKFLIEQDVSTNLRKLIMDLLRFVMEHSYLQFRGKIYHQIDGTAMGTACAPIYANIVVYMLEKQVLADMHASIHLYRRFLDDVFGYLKRLAVAAFMTRMNQLHPKLRFEFVTHDSEAAFLDLRIHKGPRFAESLIFDLSVHQKKMNLYLYIPYHSFHTDAAKRSFIQTELMRYIRNSSDRSEYSELKKIFYQRLRDRGYPSSFLLPIFGSIFYADRHFFLWPSATLHLHPLIITHPPRSACLIRRMARWFASQPAPGSATAMQSDSRPVFIIPYTPLTAALPTRQLLMRAWDMVHTATSGIVPGPIIAYQSSSSLSKTLVYSRAHLMERTRSQETASAASLLIRQSRLHSFFISGSSIAVTHVSQYAQEQLPTEVAGP